MYDFTLKSGKIKQNWAKSSNTNPIKLGTFEIILTNLLLKKLFLRPNWQFCQ